jgi:putative metallohydrolase (TIGR04338 family)
VAEPRNPRDAQRSRIYRAETPVASSPLPGLDACATFADRVVGTLWWQARFPEHTIDRTPRFRPGNGARQAFFREELDGEPTITLPRRYRTKGVVLHELVHWALWSAVDLPHHGSTFARVLLDATEEFLGPERALALTTSFSAERVRVGKPPRAGPDGRLRYGWDERLRLGKGKPLTIRWLGVTESDTASGTFVGFERSGATVRLEPHPDQANGPGANGPGAHAIPTRAIWAVEPSRR